MKDEIKVGEYIRIPRSNIEKVKKIDKKNKIIYTNNDWYYSDWLDDDQIKHSFDIIDLVEVGDYVNGKKVIYIDDCKGCMRQFLLDCDDIEKDCGRWEEEIKSIVTKEQFENMEYKVEEDD